MVPRDERGTGLIADSGREPVRILMADFPEWWLRLTAPVAISWRREAGVLLAVLGLGFALGLIVGVRLS
jgi:hypothetical protein